METFDSFFKLVNKDSGESQKHIPQEEGFRTEVVWKPQLMAAHGPHCGGLNEKWSPLGPQLAGVVWEA